MTAAAMAPGVRPPRAKFGWLRSSLSSLGSAFSGSSSSRSSMASSVSSSTSDGDSRVSLSQPRPKGKRELGELLREVMDADSNWTSETQVQTHYERIGWRVETIAGDGNCLFRAISDQLYGDQDMHKEVRRRLVDFIERERELFAPFLELEGKSVAAYCARMRRDGEWGGNPELYAAAKCFCVHLVVHQGPQRRLRIANDDDVCKGKPTEEDSESEDPAAFKTLHLLYTGNHYRSLHPGEEDTDTSTTATSEADTLEERESENHKDDCDGVTEDVRNEHIDVEVNRPPATVSAKRINPIEDHDLDIVVEERAPAQLLPSEVAAVSIDKNRESEDEAFSSERMDEFKLQPLPVETAEMPHCGVWIPQRVIFRRRGRRRLRSAVLSLENAPSMDNLALSVTTEIDFDEVDLATSKKRSSGTKTSTTASTVMSSAKSAVIKSDVADEVRRSSIFNSMDTDVDVGRPSMIETLDGAVPVVFPKRAKFFKGRSNRKMK